MKRSGINVTASRMIIYTKGLLSEEKAGRDYELIRIAIVGATEWWLP